MFRIFVHLFFILNAIFIFGQGTALPIDLRQHNLTEFNSSLFSPVFSLDRNQPESVAIWSRWQWQSIDTDPTTLFVNYSRRLDISSSIAGGFFQHNTGTFVQTGGVFNYAYGYNLKSNAQIAFGVNFFGFQRQIAEMRFQSDSNIPLPVLEPTNDFIIQFAPSLRFTVGNFGIGIVAENLYDYNFSSNARESGDENVSYIGFASYKIPVNGSGYLEEGNLQFTAYTKTIPTFDRQYGGTALLSTSKFWAQAGFNSFYGPSVGIGGKFFKKLSIGALVEYGINNNLRDRDPSFEIVTAFNFGEQDLREKIVGFSEEEETLEEKKKNNSALLLSARKKDSITAIKEAQQLAAVKEEQKRIATAYNAKQEKIEQDSLAKVAAVALTKKETELRSLQKEKEKNASQPKEKYEEVKKLAGLEPGFYLIANVFGTKKYFDSFMRDMKAKGLQPKSFYRSINKYNYVYLGYYENLEEIRKARDNRLNGRYTENLWIFRVVEK